MEPVALRAAAGTCARLGRPDFHCPGTGGTALPTGPITQLLRARAAGEDGAEARLAELVYAELHRLADRQMRGERGGHSLTPTALLHEAWLRLRPEDGAGAADRAAFLGLAARRMRQVLVDHARRRDADKRGGGAWKVTLSNLPDEAAPDPQIDVLDLEQALQQLEAHDARKARVVELRYFGGLEMVEVAQLLGVSRATAQRDWEVARAFLHLHLG